MILKAFLDAIRAVSIEYASVDPVLGLESVGVEPRIRFQYKKESK